MSGESEARIRDLFKEAKQVAPCIVFIDEIDAVVPKRENAQREMERRIVAQLLTCMEGALVTCHIEPCSNLLFRRFDGEYRQPASVRHRRHEPPRQH